MNEKKNEIFLKTYNQLKNSENRFKIRYFNMLIIVGYICMGSILFLTLSKPPYNTQLLYIVSGLLFLSPIVFLTLNLKVLKFGSMIYKGDIKNIFPDLNLPQIIKNEHKLTDSLIQHKGYHGNLIMEIQSQIDKKI
jgi:hypothetical protein